MNTKRMRPVDIPPKSGKLRFAVPVIIFLSLLGYYFYPGGEVDEVPGAPKERMAEWNEWKFGMFIHWGPWSQREIGQIWHIAGKETPEQREQSLHLYKTFNPVDFDPRVWAKIARDAGMKYVVFVTKHHDGFCNYDTAYTDSKVTDPECPYSRNENPDILRRLVRAFREEGLKIGFYFSHPDWHHPVARKFSALHWEFDRSLVDSKPGLWRQCIEYERNQVRELLTNYGKVDIFWFDIRWPFANEYGSPYYHPRIKQDIKELVRMMRRMNPGIIINNRGVDIYGDFRTPEQHIPEKGYPGYWESCMTISNGPGFWYKGKDATYKTRRELIRMLVEIAARGGNLLLNVAPDSRGNLPPAEVDRLREMGEWLTINGESIYGTAPSLLDPVNWGCSTLKGGTLYLHVFRWPAGGELFIPGFDKDVERAFLLSDSSRTPLPIEAVEEGMVIKTGPLPPDDDCSVLAVRLKNR